MIQAAREPSQPVRIKKRAKTRNPRLKMSDVHACAVAQQLVKKGIYRTIIGKNGRTLYALTEHGKALGALLSNAEMSR